MVNTQSKQSDPIQDLDFEGLWLKIVTVRAARVGKVPADRAVWAGRILETLLAGPTTAPAIAAKAKADGSTARRGGLDAALRQMSSGGEIITISRQWHLTEPLKTWLAGRDKDSRSIEIRLGVAAAGASSTATSERVMFAGILLNDENSAKYRMIEALSDAELEAYRPFATGSWDDEMKRNLIRHRKDQGVWAPTATPPRPRVFPRPDGWPDGLMTREQAMVEGVGTTSVWLSRPPLSDNNIALWITNYEPDEPSCIAMMIIRAERQLAGTWDPQPDALHSAEVIRHPAAPSSSDGDIAARHDDDDPDFLEVDEERPRPAIIVEIDGAPLDITSLADGRLDYLIGQAHAGIVDASRDDLAIMEAEWSRRVDAAGDAGIEINSEYEP